MTNSRRRRRPGSRLFAILMLLLVAGAAWWLVTLYMDRGADPTEAPIASGSESSSLGGNESPTESAPVVQNDRAAEREPLLTPEPELEPEPESTATTVTTHIEPPRPEVSEPAQVAPPSEDAPRTANAELAQALALSTSDPLAVRKQLTKLLDGTSLATADRLRAYEVVNEIAQPLFFRSGVVQGDSVFAMHRVEPSETPVSIVRKLNADCEGDLLLRVNGIADARRIGIGQVLKVPKGAFHAEVRKGEYRLNLFHGEGAERVMVASFPVGLGEFNTTPTGIFKVRPKSKLKNPQWRNPRTGEFFAADDAKNPIGERWIGLEGIEPHNQDFAGYGIHGTIEPESIGQMRSMGCIRMRAPDVEIVYEMLTAPNSTIVIAP